MVGEIGTAYLRFPPEECALLLQGFSDRDLTAETTPENRYKQIEPETRMFHNQLAGFIAPGNLRASV